MSRILLFGGGLQTLSISRGLKDYNNIVMNLGDSHAVGQFSKFIDSFSTITLSTYDPEELIGYITENRINVVIPTEDEYAEWLSIHKSLIDERVSAKLAVVDNDLFKDVINKNSLLSFCREHKIPHPTTETLNINRLEDQYREIQYPVLIKPDVSNGSRGICKINSYNELKEKAAGIVQEFGTCTIQEFIENDHYYNVMLYRYADGSFGPEVATKITRYYPIKGGSSSFCTTIKNERLVKPCKDLLEKLQWTGFADFDVLEKGEGDYRIIEINPRVPASVHAAYISDINYGQIIVEDLLNGHKLQQQYQPGQHLRFLGLDIAWFLSSPNRFKSQPSWFKFWGRDLHYQEGGIKDWKAMVYSIWSGIKKQLSPSFRKAKAGMN